MGNSIIKEFEVDMYILLYLKRITNKDLLLIYTHGTLLNVMWQPGREFGGAWIHGYVWLSPFAVYLKLSQHCSSAIYKKVKKKSS